MCPESPSAPAARPSGLSLADVSEGTLVDMLSSAYHPSGQRGVLLGIGDDAAVVSQPSGSVVATTDTMVKDLDWRDDWSSATDVGRKIVVQNIADVVAMGAWPTGLLVTLAADPATSLDWVLDLARAIGAEAATCGAPVVGGDLSSAPPGVVTISITALGDLHGRAPVRRGGARPGDIVAVGGSLGWSGAGLALYLRGETTSPTRRHEEWSEPEKAADLVRWYHRTPSVSVASGPRAAVAGATSMIDISDGLSRDAGRIAASSWVRIALDRSVLVRGFVEASPVGEALGAESGLDQVLHGGEEHSLLATFPAGIPMTFDPDCAWAVIGRVEDLADGEAPVVTLDGEPLATKAWDHFAG